MAQNDAIRTIYVKAKIDMPQLNSKCKLCDNKDKMINHTISKCSKLVYQYTQTSVPVYTTGNCARNLNLTLVPDGICINQNLFWRMKCTKFSRILR